MDLLAIGNITLDSVADVDRLPKPGRTALISRSRICYGGRGANVAVIVAKLGLTVDLASFVGDDFPEGYVRNLESNNINMSRVRKIKEAQSARIFAFKDCSQGMIYFLDPIAIPAKEKLPVSVNDLKNYRGVFIAPLDSDRHIGEFHDELLKLRNVFLSLGEEVYRKDCGLLRRFIRFPQYLFMNQQEFSEFTRILRIKSTRSLFKLAPRLLALAVTVGDEGSRAYTRRKSLSIPSVPSLKRTELGAGDAFVGGFIFSVLSGGSLLNSMRIGTVIASMAIEKDNVQSLDANWARIKKRYVLSFDELPDTWPRNSSNATISSHRSNSQAGYRQDQMRD